MFEIYNAVTRGMGAGGTVSFGVFAGQSVLDPLTGFPRFAHTVHTIARGIKKLNLSLPSMEMYRGLTSMKLPDQFLTGLEFVVNTSFPRVHRNGATRVKYAIKQRETRSRIHV